MVNEILTWNCFECNFKCSKLSDIEFDLKWKDKLGSWKSYIILYLLKKLRNENRK